MKILKLFPIVAVLALFASCEKAPTEAEKNAQIEKEVQQRLDAEHQTSEQQRLAQQQADLDARERALANKESAAAAATPRATPRIASSSSAVSENAGAPRSYDTFYRKLEPYGSWRETSDYGYVFQPREAQSRNWRPYTDGRWTYTDAGWTWVSDESFGWATYHYGRWTKLNEVGWVWVPGEEWAPAWVSWRKGDQNVGWAPLPPEARFDRNKGIHKWADNYYDISAGEYVFIPNEEIGAENVQRSVIPSERNFSLVNETTNVTNITYSNTTVVNEGPNYDELRAHSRRPLERLRIQRESDVERDQSPRATVHGDVLQMVTPLFAAHANERPRTNAPALGKVNVDRGFAGGGNQGEFDRARAKMRSEATPPPDAPIKRFEKPRLLASAPVPGANAIATPEATATIAAAPAVTATPPTPPPSATPQFVPRTIPTIAPAAEVPRATRPPRPSAPPVIPATPTGESSPAVKSNEGETQAERAATTPAIAATPRFVPRTVPTTAPAAEIPHASRPPRPSTPAIIPATPADGSSPSAKANGVEAEAERAAAKTEQLRKNEVSRAKETGADRGVLGTPPPAAPAASVTPAPEDLGSRFSPERRPDARANGPQRRSVPPVPTVAPAADVDASAPPSNDPREQKGKHRGQPGGKNNPDKAGPNPTPSEP